MLTGAEKLLDSLPQAFEDRFGIRPLEGYGITECSPVITVGSPGFRGAGLYQPGAVGVKTNKLPALGTGKLDLRAVKRIASERLGKAMACGESRLPT